MSDCCQEHGKLTVDIAKMQKDITFIRENFSDKIVTIDAHIKESVMVRDMVKDNSAFRKGATRSLWILFAAVIGIIARIITFKL